MGFLDFLFTPFFQSGQQTLQNVTGQQQVTPGGQPGGIQPTTYQQQPPPQPVQINPINTITSWGSGAINYVGSGITNISSGIQNFIQPVSQPITQPMSSWTQAAGIQGTGPSSIPFTPSPSMNMGGGITGGAGYTNVLMNSAPIQMTPTPTQASGILPTPQYKGGSSDWAPNYTGWFQDPRTRLMFPSEQKATDWGYNKPVNLPGTIVMVGSQGTYAQGGSWITSIEQFNAPGADYSGYRNLGIANYLYNTPSSDAGYARDWIGSYAGMQGRGNVPLSSGAGGIGAYSVLNDMWGADYGKVDMMKYNSTNLDAGGNIPRPFIGSYQGGNIQNTQLAPTGTVPQPPSTNINPFSVFLSSVSQGTLPTLSALWESTPIAKISSNWSWNSSPESLNTAVTTSIDQSKGWEGFTRIAGVVPMTSGVPGATTAFTPIVKGGLAVIGIGTVAMAGFSSQLPKTTSLDSYVYRTDPMEVWLEGGVQFGDVLTSAPSTLTGGLIPAWTPGADLLTRYGQNANQIGDKFTSNMAAVEAQKPQYDQLGSHITATQTQLNQMLSGKINTQGQFTGTAAEYSAYKAALSDMNADVATYNKYGESVKGVISEGYKTGAIIPSGNGGYQPNPDLARKYGAFSEWSADTTRWLRGGTTEAQIAAYEQSPAFKSGGLWNAWGEGSWKALTNPVGLANSALLGVGMYAGMGLASAGFTALAPVAVNGITPAAAATLAESIGAGGLRTMASPIFQYGTGAAFLGAGVWGSTEGFTAPPERSMSNLGGMTIHLAAMTAGALAPEGIATYGTQFSTGFSDRMTVIKQRQTNIDYSVQPGVNVASGKVGEMRITEMERTLSPTIVNVAGYDIPVFPRIRTPEFKGVDVKPGTIDVGRLLGERFTGTEAYPLTGTRQIITELRSSAFSDTLFTGGQEGALYPGQPQLSHGVGEMRISETRLPRTIDEYVRMGATDQKLIGLSGEEITASLMENARQVTPATTGYRNLDVYVPRGTDIGKAFDWTANVQGGTRVEFNRMVMEEHFGSLSVEQTGTPRSAYEQNIIRDITEQGFTNTGNWEITGAQTPDTLITRQLQETIRNMRTGDVERFFAFEETGGLGYEGIGTTDSISAQTIIEGAKAVGVDTGQPASFAHTHPADPWLKILRETGPNGEPISLFQKVRSAILQREPLTTPSTEDIFNMAINPENLLTEYIASPRGVTKISPGEGGWWDLSRISDNVPEGVAIPLDLIRKAGANAEFIGKNELYTSKTGYQARSFDVTGDMQMAYPEGIRNQIVDVFDRMVLNNPNMEFIREPIRVSGGTPSLLESGGGLPGWRIGGYSSPMASMQTGLQTVSPESSFRQSIVEPARGQKISGGTEFVTAGVPKSTFMEPMAMEGPSASTRAIIGPSLIGATQFNQAFGQFSQSQPLLQVQPQGQKSSVDVVRALTMGSDITQTQTQNPMQDFVKALAMGSAVIQVPTQRPMQESVRALVMGVDLARSLRQEQPQDYARAMAFDVAQTPWQDTRQNQRQTPFQIPGLITPQIPIVPQIQVPWKPVPPVPLVPWFPSFPNFPGSGPGPFQRKRKGAFVEIFNMGLDYSLRQRSKRQGKSWAQPKKVQQARSAAKKGAKKK